MPKHPLISIPLDIPDVRVLQTELTKAGELLFSHSAPDRITEGVARLARSIAALL